jgi:P4 family phage/plasmid primase-like protien
MSLAENTEHVESGHASIYKKTQETDSTSCGANGNAEHVDRAGAADPVNIGRDPEQNNGAATGDIVTELRDLLGQDAVLLPIHLREKGPRIPGWQHLSLDRMNDEAYLAQLRAGNIGVLLGDASGGLCAIDIDADDQVEPFLALNPRLASTLRTRGARGAQLWVKIVGEYPKLTKLKTRDGDDWGEWRCDGGQSVIHGVHPDGMNYRRIVDEPPIEVAFDEIHWPEHLKLPWVKDDYDALVEADGLPFTVSEKGGVTLNQLFFVRKYMLEHRVLYDASIGEFFEYDQASGLWVRQTVESIKRAFASDLTKTAKESGHHSIFSKRTDGLLVGLVSLLRSLAEKQDVFANRPRAVHVANGMICFEGDDVVLRSFHPDFLSRNQCPFAFDPEADCPRFKSELLGSALDEDDIRLFQKWAGGVLLGRNSAQRLLLLLGTPSGGKSTVMDVIERTAGLQNVSQLRTEHLGDRFELFGFVGKTLLTGKDVAADFLMSKGAYVLKALVGGDLLEAEKKGLNQRVHVRGDFNVGITCNADLNIRLEGDVGAWRRRLLVIKYDRPAPAKPIPDFAEQLLAEEGPGILRWMMEGAIELLNDLQERGNYILTEGQKARIDRLMDQSDSTRRFVEEGVIASKGSEITVAELLTAYYEFCEQRGWYPMSTRDLNTQLPRHMLEVHKSHKRHDFKRGESSNVRGYKHVRLAVPVGGAE